MNPATKSARLIKIALVLAAVIAVGSVIENFRLLGEVNALKNPQAAAQNQLQKTLGEVSKLLVLPTDETPTIATVSDISKLKDQPFFAHAAVGDQVIIYTTAKKAILWRPSEHKIVEVAPLNVNADQTAAANTAAASAAPKR